MLNIKAFQPVDEAFHMLIVGQQGAGKTTCCASLLRKSTLLLYVSALEGHSPSYMNKGCSLYEGASPNNLLAVAVDKYEEWDKDVLPEIKAKVGDSLSPDHSMLKLHRYLDRATGNVDNVVIDSLSAFCTAIIKNSSDWKNLCLTDKGKHNNFAESPAFIECLQKIFTKLNALKVSGINCITLCGAKAVDIESDSKEVSTIAPELPFYGVVEKIMFWFPDITVITKEDIPGMPKETRVFNFGVNVTKTSKDFDTGKLKKFINITPRLVCKPLDLEVEMLPADILKIKENIAILKGP